MDTVSYNNSNQYDLQTDRYSLQNQIKRQREWVYLAHYLAIQGLDPVHIISGQDDGYEPDFTLVFWEHNQLVYIGIELTTLPRLRTQISATGLILKRWYWQALRIVAKQQIATQAHDADEGGYLNVERFKIPLKTMYMPNNQFLAYKQGKTLSKITQSDVNAVMSKKSAKTDAYQTRRSLDELWLLIHTDKYQPDNILTFADQHLITKGVAADKTPSGPETTTKLNATTTHDALLHHHSSFDRVHITCYPSYKVLTVHKK